MFIQYEDISHSGDTQHCALQIIFLKVDPMFLNTNVWSCRLVSVVRSWLWIQKTQSHEVKSETDVVRNYIRCGLDIALTGTNEEVAGASMAECLSMIHSI